MIYEGSCDTKDCENSFWKKKKKKNIQRPQTFEQHVFFQ